jgi:hypothetical protein
MTIRKVLFLSDALRPAPAAALVRRHRRRKAETPFEDFCEMNGVGPTEGQRFLDYVGACGGGERTDCLTLAYLYDIWCVLGRVSVSPQQRKVPPCTEREASANSGGGRMSSARPPTEADPGRTAPAAPSPACRSLPATTTSPSATSPADATAGSSSPTSARTARTAGRGSRPSSRETRRGAGTDGYDDDERRALHSVSLMWGKSVIRNGPRLLKRAGGLKPPDDEAAVPQRPAG